MTSIPKILHQIWIGPKPAPVNLMKTWKDKHPDWEYILWNEEEISNRGLEFECIQQINNIQEINGKADIIRWEILYKYGGYFVDADSICIEPFDEYFENTTAFATFENENVRAGLVATGTMGFIPKYSMCRDIIEWIKYSDEAQTLIRDTRAWYSVGPALLTKILDTGKYSDFTVYPSHCFLPIHFTGPKYEGHKKVYGYQEWGTAKQSYDTMNSVVLPQELLTPPKNKWYSVLITSYNTNRQYVRECLDSIKNQIGYFGIEIVWIDDGSTEENSAELHRELDRFIKNSRFTTYIYKKNEINIGTAKSSNIGLSICSSEIVFKMDSDDIMLPDRMSKQIEFMNKNQNAVLCGANIKLFHSRENNQKNIVNQTNHAEKITWDDLFRERNSWYINNPTICYRKSAIQAVGNYRTNDDRILYLHEDYDLLARVLKRYQIVYNIPDVLLLYRLHSSQLTHGLIVQSPENVQLRRDIIENAYII